MALKDSLGSGLAYVHGLNSLPLSAKPCQRKNKHNKYKLQTPKQQEHRVAWLEVHSVSNQVLRLHFRSSSHFRSSCFPSPQSHPLDAIIRKGGNDNDDEICSDKLLRAGTQKHRIRMVLPLKNDGRTQAALFSRVALAKTPRQAVIARKSRTKV